MLFYVLAVFNYMTGGWLHQADPLFFNTRFDGATWLYMLTNLHQLPIQNNMVQWVFDILFYAWPALYFFCYGRSKKLCVAMGLLWFVVNFIYVQAYTLYPTNSIEGHIAYLLFPLVFALPTNKSFGLGVGALRYFFIYFFASAAVWKAVQGGLFFPQQMTGILLQHHAEYLLSAPESWQTRLIYFVAQRQWLGFALYWAATLLELVFVIGFFTKKFDAWLVRGAIVFLMMDVLIMRIPYFSILPFMLCFAFSKSLPGLEAEKEG